RTMPFTALKPAPVASGAMIQRGLPTRADGDSAARDFWPSLMAVKPWGVTYFSPLRGARVSVTTGMFLSEDMAGERTRILLFPGHRLRLHVSRYVFRHALRRSPGSKPRNWQGFAVYLEFLVLVFNTADQLFAFPPGVTLVDGKTGAGVAVGDLLDELVRDIDGHVRIDFRRQGHRSARTRALQVR